MKQHESGNPEKAARQQRANMLVDSGIDMVPTANGPALVMPMQWGIAAQPPLCGLVFEQPHTGNRFVVQLDGPSAVKLGEALVENGEAVQAGLTPAPKPQLFVPGQV